MNNYVFWLSLIVFLPTIGALVIAFIPKDRVDALRGVALAITALTFLVSIGVLLGPFADTHFNTGVATMQNGFAESGSRRSTSPIRWAIDGISLPLVLLTTLISLLAMAASWSITKYVKAYCILFLILETAMLGVFLALDFFLFFVFWEVMLLPMYFLIGVWGGPRREYAAIKFFLYTLLGGVLMLIAILMLYFKSDLRAIAKLSELERPESELHDCLERLASIGCRRPRRSKSVGVGAGNPRSDRRPRHRRFTRSISWPWRPWASTRK